MLSPRESRFPPAPAQLHRGRAARAAPVLPRLAAAHPPSCLLRPAPVASLDLALAVHITSSLLYLLPSVLVSPGEVAVEVAGSKKPLGGKRRRWQRVVLKSPLVSGSILDFGTGVCVVGRWLSVCSAGFWGAANPLGSSDMEMDRSSGTSLPNSQVIPGVTLEFSVLQPLEQGMVGFPNPSVAPAVRHRPV